MRHRSIDDGQGASPTCRIVIGIATTGRCSVLREVLIDLQNQTRRPDMVSICAVKESDVDRASAAGLSFPTQISLGPKGSSAQRNIIIDSTTEYDVILFMDDDFLPCDDYLANLERLFAASNDIIVATGKLIADGARGPGYGIAEARDLISRVSKRAPTPFIQDVYAGYGCNLAVRADQVRKHAIRFDEELPLYGWLEDTDFSRRCARFGRVVRCNFLSGVHMAAKIGRSSGVMFGYSQIANPIHLFKKGSVTAGFAAHLVLRPFIANLVRAAYSEPYLDRLGRLKGNLSAIRDLLRGRLHPMNIIR